MSTTHNHSPFAADVASDAELRTTVLSLFYTDEQHPERSMTVGVAPELGSNLCRFRLGAHELIYADHETLLHKGFTGDFVLWPFPNRVRDKRYSFEGKEYSLAPVQRVKGDNALIHGLVFDRAWQYEQPVVTNDSASVTTSVAITRESPLFECYPFESSLSLTYTLNREGLSITYQVKNNGDQVLPYGFALHPYFSVLSNRQQTYVTLPANTVMESDAGLLPTGRLLDVTGLMYAQFDLRSPASVNTLKLDHVYTDLLPGTQAVIDYRHEGFQLHVGGSADFTHAVIYTSPESATSATPFFCLEHQTCSTDAINLHNQGAERQKMAHLLELKPGETGSGTLHYTPHFAN